MGIAEVMEQALALPDREPDAKSAAYIGRQAGAVPHFEAKIFRVMVKQGRAQGGCLGTAGR